MRILTMLTGNRLVAWWRMVWHSHGDAHLGKHGGRSQLGTRPCRNPHLEYPRGETSELARLVVARRRSHLAAGESEAAATARA